MVFSYAVAPGVVNGTNIDFYDDTFYNTPPYTNGSVTGCIYLEGNVSANVYNNLFNVPATGNANAGIKAVTISNEQPQNPSLVRILNNTFIIGAYDNAQSVALSWGGSSNVPAPPGAFYYEWASNNNVVCENNIEYSFATTQYGVLFYNSNVVSSNITTLTSACVVNYNDYYSDAPTQFYWFYDLPWADWMGGLPELTASNGWDAASITNIPQFVSLSGSWSNSVANNYSITSGPTIGAGINLSTLGLPGLNADINGQTNGRPTSGSWNMGAY
jgi:hypothetical protein